MRRFPGSRRHPQFAGAELAQSLGRAGIAYLWLPSLGGRRRPDPDSQNTGWRHTAFRGYADHMLGEEFAEGLFELLMVANGLNTAIMCAELLWWRCHRRLIADALIALGYGVGNIMGTEPVQPHRLLSPAHLENGRLSYAPLQAGLPFSSEPTGR